MLQLVQQVLHLAIWKAIFSPEFGGQMEKSKPYPNITYAMQFCDTYLMHAQRYSQHLTHFNKLNP